MVIRFTKLRRLPWRFGIEFVATATIVACLLHMALITDEGSSVAMERGKSRHKTQTHTTVRPHRPPDAMFTTHIAIVVCSNRLEQGIVAIKSAMVLARRPVYLHLFLDRNKKGPMAEHLSNWKKLYGKKLTYRMYEAKFPSIVNHDEWNRIYGPCACLRLFFPEMMLNQTRFLYIDSDTVFLRPPEELWDQFNDFGSQQIMGASYDHIVKRNGFIPRKKKIPLFKPGRLQSGVLLMDLDRMRSFGWTDHVIKFHDYWRNKDNFTSHLFDQAAINLAFYFNPEKLYLVDCDWNYRPYHFLMDGHECVTAEKDGVSLVHGYQYAFHGNEPTVFKAFYWAFRDHKPGDSLQSLLGVISMNLKVAIEKDGLKRSSDKFELFLKRFRNYV